MTTERALGPDLRRDAAEAGASNIDVTPPGRGGAAGAARGADAQAAVGEGERAAERHDESAEPDQPHQRIEVEAHDEAAPSVISSPSTA